MTATSYDAMLLAVAGIFYGVLALWWLSGWWDQRHVRREMKVRRAARSGFPVSYKRKE